MTGTEALQVAAQISTMADPWVLKMEGTDLSGEEKHAAVKGMVRMLIFGASTLSPAVATLMGGVSVQQVDAMIDVAIAGLIMMYNAAKIFVAKIKQQMHA